MKKALYIIAFIISLTSCQRDEPIYDMLITTDEDIGKETNSGIVIGFDTQDIDHNIFDNLHIFIFDHEDRLTRHNYHTDMEQVALERKLLDNGQHTIFAVFNTNEGLLEQITTDSESLYFSDFIYRIDQIQASGDYSFMLTGVSRHVLADGISQLIIHVTNEQIATYLTSLTLDLIYPSNTLPPYTKSDKLSLRSVVEVFQSGTNTKILSRYFDNTTPKTLVLNPGVYDIRVWSDYSQNSNTDLYYNTSDTKNVTILSQKDYTANSDYKDAFAKEVTVTVSDKPNQVAEVALIRPLAKYRIEAIDVEEFYAKHDSLALEDLHIEVVYEGFFPTAYDMTIPALSGADINYKFNGSISQTENKTATIATDYIMVNGKESSVIVSVYVRTKSGYLISSVQGILIAYKSGHLTTISGNFLTSGQGGISIDTEWDDDFNIYF